MWSFLRISLCNCWSWGRAKPLLRRNTAYGFYQLRNSLVHIGTQNLFFPCPGEKQRSQSSFPRNAKCLQVWWFSAYPERAPASGLDFHALEENKKKLRFLLLLLLQDTLVGGEAKQYLLGNIKHFTEKDLPRPVLQPFSHASHSINPRAAAHMSEATRVRAVLAHSSTSKGYGMSCTVMILFHFLPLPLIYWETPRKSLNLSKTKFTQGQEHSEPPTILVKCSEVLGGKMYLQIISVSAFMEINLSFCV